MHTMLLVNSTEKIRLVLGKTIAPLFKAVSEKNVISKLAINQNHMDLAA